MSTDAQAAAGRAFRRAGLRLLTGAAVLAVGIVALELTFGFWWSATGWDRALALNIVVNRTVVYDASSLYSGGGRVVYTRDRYGLRGDYGAPEDITVLTLGGSATDQRYLSDGLTWHDELQRRLRAAGHPATVANAGVDGHSTFGHLASYDYWLPLIPGLRPRYTILFVGVNDFFLREPVLPWEGTPDGTALLWHRIRASSAFYRVYATVQGAALARRMGLGHTRIDLDRIAWADTPRLRDHGAVGQSHARAFEERFARLLDRVRAAGSEPVCVTQPSWYYRFDPDGRVMGADMDLSFEGAYDSTPPINGIDYFHLRRMFDGVMLASCTSRRAPTIDLAVAAWEASDFYDFVHMTPSGARKLGRRIAAAMEGLPW